jgi:hypothetical protein
MSEEFYPNGEAAASEPVEPAIGQSERDEQLSRICELTRRLGAFTGLVNDTHDRWESAYVSLSPSSIGNVKMRESWASHLKHSIKANIVRQSTSLVTLPDADWERLC